MYSCILPGEHNSHRQMLRSTLSLHLRTSISVFYSTVHFIVPIIAKSPPLSPVRIACWCPSTCHYHPQFLCPLGDRWNGFEKWIRDILLMDCHITRFQSGNKVCKNLRSLVGNSSDFRVLQQCILLARITRDEPTKRGRKSERIFRVDKRKLENIP